VIVITKIDSADRKNVKILESNIHKFNPAADVVRANLALHVEDPAKIKGKRVLVVEDGPTLTHGEMLFGAGVLAAKRFGALEQISPRPYLVGKMAATFKQYPNIQGLLPAMGYGGQQVKDLEATINKTPCDTVLIATPVDLRRICKIEHDTCRVTYDIEEIGQPTLSDALDRLELKK
jgi:predicted GTPase